nr:MAG TPA: Homeodomain-like domain [Caudoviricetes sp.]
MNLEQLQAKKLYAEGKTVDEIASALNKSKGTVYRWIKENKEEFEKAKKLAQMTPNDMIGFIDEAHKKVLLDIAENPEKIKNPKVADALIKIATVLEKLGNRSEKEQERKKKEEIEERGVLIVDDVKAEGN